MVFVHMLNVENKIEL